VGRALSAYRVVRCVCASRACPCCVSLAVSVRSPFRCVRRCVGNALAVASVMRSPFRCVGIAVRLRVSLAVSVSVRRIGSPASVRRASVRRACIGCVVRVSVALRVSVACIAVRMRCVACVAVRMRSLVAVRFPCAVSCVSVRRVCPAPTGRLRVRPPCVCVSVSVRRACEYRRRAYRRRALPCARRACIGVSVLRRSSVRRRASWVRMSVA